MKKIMIASLGLSLLTGTTAMFAQNTSTSTDTMKSDKKMKHKKSKKDTASSTTTSK